VEKTETWVLFDEKNLYISARCFDSQPDKIVANELRRDSFNIYLNDNFSVVLDTFYDRRNGFQFYTNPVGGLYDGYITDERDSNRDWNTVWDARTQRFEGGWTVEMAIPFKSLRYQRGDQQVWGINFRRIIRSRNEFDYLTPIPRSYSGAALKPRRPPRSWSEAFCRRHEPRSQTIPARRHRNDRRRSLLFQPVRCRAGFWTPHGLTRSLTADFTYNTDFAQVENDEQQVNLTPLQPHFPEARFLSGRSRDFHFRRGGHAGRHGWRRRRASKADCPVSRRFALQPAHRPD
jgi:hypothetical protein